MKIKRQLSAIFTICLAAILAIGCGDKKEWPKQETIDKNLNIAIYAATETDGQLAPVEPPLLQEIVSLHEIIHYDSDGDFITVPFRFKDSTKYARITAANINKRIAITANGEIVATPIVKMRIGNGACSFLLSKEQAKRLFTKEKVEKLLPDD